MKTKTVIVFVSLLMVPASVAFWASLRGQLPTGLLRVDETIWRVGPLDSDKVDWGLFPEAYGLLASDRLMQPVDVGDWPVRIGRERQLFVDNHLVSQVSLVRRTVHQPAKDPRNPIMVAETPWEQDKKLIVLQVLREPAGGKFRMWYTSWARFTYPGSQAQGRMPTLYAESEDGIHWVRPNLGLLEYNGSKENNWVLYARMYGLIHHPDAADPQRRYLAAVLHERPYVTVDGVYLYGSPDGLRWTRLRERPILPLLHGSDHFPLRGLGDTSLIRYDPLLQLYVCDAKIAFRRPSFRTRGIATSPDLIHWSSPRMTIFPDSQDQDDAQIYANVSFVYESMWLGMLRVFHQRRTGWKQVEVELTSSRDGLNWSRVADRDVFIPLGDDSSWERDYTDPAHNGPLLVGDELWFYYRGSRNVGAVVNAVPNTPEAEAGETWEFATGLARLRRDGFVSLDASEQPGTVVTRPLSFSGKTLFINAAVRPGGEIRVGVLDADGQPVAGLTPSECEPFTRDSTAAQIGWRQAQDLASTRAAHEHLRLQFVLDNAELYSFWIE